MRTTHLPALSLFLWMLAVDAQAQSIYAVVWGHPKYVVGSSTLHSGLFRSTDLGRTWSHLGPKNLKAFSMDVVDSSRGRILYIAAGNGVHRSTDSGATWKIVTDWRMTEVLDVHVDQRNPSLVFAATAFGFWRSTDGGDTWEQPAGSLKDVYVRELFGTNELFAYTEEPWAGSDEFGYWQSPDGGVRWNALGAIKRSPGVTIGEYRSHGDRWTVGTTTLVGTWGDGVYRQDEDRWIQSGLEGSQVWSLVIKSY